MLTSSGIKQQARSVGFDLAGIAAAATFPELGRLTRWLNRGYAGEMTYLHRSASVREEIRQFLPTAQSVIVTGTVYYTRESGPNGDVSSSTARARIARYAWGEDYHVVLAERLETLLAWMREQTRDPFDARIFVDKHPVQERVFAKHAGLGWIGKNTCLINPEIGSWVLLAGLAVSLDLELDAAQEDRCGACTLCIDACPTGALVDEYEMDATRCISYLTIEHKSSIPEGKRHQVEDHVFGCDICQEVCPFNLAPLATLDPIWQPGSGRATSSAAELWLQSDSELHGLIAGSAMTRVSLSRLRRNLAVVLGNSEDPDTAALLDRPGGGVPHAAPSAETALVQEHVEWAKMKLREL
jgi:epoxyqueuosine reductase